jgi:hypothetical protein
MFMDATEFISKCWPIIIEEKYYLPIPKVDCLDHDICVTSFTE